MTDNRCTIPWTYPIEVNLQANVMAACCKMPRVSMGDGGLMTQQLLTVRMAIKSNVRHPGCASCWAIDDAGGLSQRRRHSQHFHKPIDWPSLEVWEPVHNVSVMFSNVCQMQCFYCGPDASSMWAKAEERKGVIKVINAQVTYKYLPDVLDVNQITNIHITGGEPMLESKCIEFLMNLAPVENLGIVTNLSYGEAVMSKLLAVIDRHPNIAISCSLDAIGDNPSRKGFNWQLWKRNFEVLAEGFMYRKVNHGARYLHINVVVSMFNYKDVQGIIDYVIGWRARGVFVTFDLSPLALDQPGSTACVEDREALRKAKLHIPDDPNALTQKEIAMVLRHNQFLFYAKYNPSLRERMDQKLKEYVTPIEDGSPTHLVQP